MVSGVSRHGAWDQATRPQAAEPAYRALARYYRTVKAVEDFCLHRGARLSLGHVCNGEIACEYHGVQLNGDGVVTATPPTPNSPIVGRKLITSYPAWSPRRDLGVFP